MAEESIVPGYLAKRNQLLARQGQVTFTYSAWDNSVYGPKIVIDADGTWRMFYTGYEVAYASWRICVATSTDKGVTWTKPNLGQFTYAGNTNNNICLQASDNLQFADVIIDPKDGLYLMCVRNDVSGSCLIYSSSDGITFTFVSVPMNGTTGTDNGGFEAHPDSYVEIKALTWNPTAGKYRAWYNHKHVIGTPANGRRTIGYYDCATLTGTWVNRGPIAEFTSTVVTLQYYDFSPFYYAGSLWAVVNIYNNTTELLSPLRLYRSDDHGDTWVRSTDLLRRSGAAEWDYGLVTDGCPILVDGIWYFFYGGKTGNHASTVQITFGKATVALDPAVANLTTLLAEMAKIPKSDAAVTWNATALASINTQADLALTDYDGPTNAELAAALDVIPTAVENADTLLNRDMSAVSDTNARTPLNALRFLRNRWSLSGTTLTVTEEDDTTTAWTAVVTASPGADPISGSNPT